MTTDPKALQAQIQQQEALVRGLETSIVLINQGMFTGASAHHVINTREFLKQIKTDTVQNLEMNKKAFDAIIGGKKETTNERTSKKPSKRNTKNPSIAAVPTADA